MAGQSGAPPAEQQGEKSGQQQSGKEPDTFTQEQVNSLLANHKRELRSQLDASQQELSALRDSVKGYEEKVTSIDTMLKGLMPPAEEEEVDPFAVDDPRVAELLKPPPWVKTASDKALWTTIRKTQLVVGDRDKALQEQLKVLEAESKAATDRWKKAEEREKTAEEKRRAVLKREILTDIFTKARGVDLKAVQKYFSDDLVYDEKADAWLYRTAGAGGELVDPLIGCLKEFPDFLKEPLVVNGGSGSHGQRTTTPESELAQAESAMAEWAARARTGNRQALA